MSAMQEQNPREGVELVEPWDFPSLLCMSACYAMVAALGAFLMGWAGLEWVGASLVYGFAAGVNSYCWTEILTEDCA